MLPEELFTHRTEPEECWVIEALKEDGFGFTAFMKPLQHESPAFLMSVVFAPHNETWVASEAISLREAAHLCLSAIRERLGWTEAKLVENLKTLSEMRVLRGEHQ